MFFFKLFNFYSELDMYTCISAFDQFIAPGCFKNFNIKELSIPPKCQPGMSGY